MESRGLRHVVVVAQAAQKREKEFRGDSVNLSNLEWTELAVRNVIIKLSFDFTGE